MMHHRRKEEEIRERKEKLRGKIDFELDKRQRKALEHELRV